MSRTVNLPPRLFRQYAVSKLRRPGRRCRTRLTKTLFRRARALEAEVGPVLAMLAFHKELARAHLTCQMARTIYDSI